MVRTSQSHRGPHEDPGLQPERTVLAWGRTMLALVTVSVIFIRWLPQYGLPILLLVAVSVIAAGTIYLTQQQRYRTSAHGIRKECIDADTTAVLWTSFAGLLLGGLAVTVVLAS